jgi:hypothetical protein
MEVAGLFRDDMDVDSTQPPPSYNVAGGLFRANYLASGESSTDIWSLPFFEKCLNSLNVLKIKYTKFTKKTFGSGY